nr:ATP-binding cassette domain-containing protein [Actinomyces israelii]
MIGRAPVCAVIVSHPRVSREHLMVEPTPVGWRATCAAGRSMLIDGRWATSAILTRETRIQLVDQFGPLISLTPTGGALGPGGAPVGAVPAAPPRPPTSVAPTGIPGPPGPPTGGASAAPPGPPAGFPPTAAVPASAGPPANGVSVGPPGPPTGASPPGPPTGGLPASAASAPSAASTVMLGSGGASTSGPPEPTGVTSAGGAASGDLAATGEVTISGSGTIGRRPDNSFIVNDPTMSGRHARVDVTPQGAVVTDLGSTNGTFVSGQRVDHYVVTEPTVFGMGSTFVQVDPNGKCSIPVPVNSGELVGKDLTFSVNDGRLRLLDGVSFKLPGNELLAVVGPSGAGKSTLLKALTGEQKAQAGQVLFDGLDVYEHYPVMRNKIGVVPQNDVIHSALTVRQTLEYAAELRFAKDVSRAERRGRIDEVLEDLDLSEHVGKRVKRLSGGQRKRVSTAIELLTRPSLLFLDEPTSGLDPQLDRDVMELLATLAHGTRPGDTGRTVMVVTHNENHIDRADKVLILAAGGRPVYFGSPRLVVPYFRERLAELRAAGQLVVRAPRGGFPDPGQIEGFADVYALIRNHTDVLRAHLEAVEPSTRRGDGRRIPTALSASRPKAPQQSAARQVSTLVRRHARIIAADPSYLAFMLVLPVIMGLLTKVISGNDGFAKPEHVVLDAVQAQQEGPSPAVTLLVILITGAAFSGMSVTIRELVGERDVFLREKAVGLRAGAYLVAKMIVLGLIVTVQTVLMMGIALALNKHPSGAVLLGSPGLELAVCCWAVAFASGLLGLAVSAFVSSSEQVMPVLVVSIMGQLVLAGGVVPITGRAVFEQLSWLMPARWGYAMASSTIAMNEIIPYRADDLWEHTKRQWLTDYGFLTLIGLVCMIACYIGLARRGRR